MKTRTNQITDIAAALFILLWIYAASSKLLHFVSYTEEMSHQVFNATFSNFLVYAIPTVEILLVLLLLFEGSRLFGLKLSLMLISVFSLYIILILAGFYQKVPCSCGGVLKKLGWASHLAFNLAFVAIGSMALLINLKREGKGKEE